MTSLLQRPLGSSPKGADDDLCFHPRRSQANDLAVLISRMQSSADQVEKNILQSEELLALVRIPAERRLVKADSGYQNIRTLDYIIMHLMNWLIEALSSQDLQNNPSWSSLVIHSEWAVASDCAELLPPAWPVLVKDYWLIIVTGWWQSTQSVGNETRQSSLYVQNWLLYLWVKRWQKSNQQTHSMSLISLEPWGFSNKGWYEQSPWTTCCLCTGIPVCHPCERHEKSCVCLFAYSLLHCFSFSTTVT